MQCKNMLCVLAQRYSRRIRQAAGSPRRFAGLSAPVRHLRAFLKSGEDGQAMVEMAFVTPVILLILTGIVSFGIAMNQYELLTYGTGDGARAFALSRNQANWSPTSASDPCGYTYDIATGAMPTLSTSNLTMTITYTPPTGSDHTAQTWTVNGSSGCSSFALDGTDINGTVTVQTTYPVFPVLWGWSSSYKLNLTATSSQQIQ